MAKYELIALLPLAGTEEELKTVAGKIEEKITAAGGTVVGSKALQKGRLAYAVGKARQGYYHCLQFEMDPKVLGEFRRGLLLSGLALRVEIKKVEGEFKVFVPSAPASRTVPARPGRPLAPVAPLAVAKIAPIATVATTTLSQESVKPEETKKISLEEIDKRLEQILGET